MLAAKCPVRTGATETGGYLRHECHCGAVINFGKPMRKPDALNAARRSSNLNLIWDVLCVVLMPSSVLAISRVAQRPDVLRDKLEWKREAFIGKEQVRSTKEAAKLLPPPGDGKEADPVCCCVLLQCGYGM